MINEIHIGPDGSWIELYNTSTVTVRVSCGILTWNYTLDGVNWQSDTYEFPQEPTSSTWLAPGEYVILLVELFPAKKPNGQTPNYLGEPELTSDQINGTNLTASLADPRGFTTTVSVPLAQVGGDASIILTNGDPALYRTLLAGAPFIPVDVVRKVLLTNGQIELPAGAGSISMRYAGASLPQTGMRSPGVIC